MRETLKPIRISGMSRPLPYGGIIHTGSKGLTHECVDLSNKRPRGIKL